MSASQEFCFLLIFLFATFVNLCIWFFIDVNDLKHPGVPIGVLLAIDIGILITMFLGLFGVFG